MTDKSLLAGFVLLYLAIGLYAILRMQQLPQGLKLKKALPKKQIK